MGEKLHPTQSFEYDYFSLPFSVSLEEKKRNLAVSDILLLVDVGDDLKTHFLLWTLRLHRQTSK